MNKKIDELVVIKVGTKSMFDGSNGSESLDQVTINQIGEQVIRLKELGYSVVIVSSGAVTAGMSALGLSKRPDPQSAMPEIQRLATIGWHRVLGAWDQALAPLIAGGLLVTQRELSIDIPERDEVLRTTYTLLAHGDVPILNENDAITHGELAVDSFGQNDELAAIFCVQLSKSKLFGEDIRLVLLSDVDGLYEDYKQKSSLVRTVDNIDEFEDLALDQTNAHGKGGMKAKLKAAKLCHSAGIDMWIANGKETDSVERALSGQIGTYFPAKKRGI